MISNKENLLKSIAEALSYDTLLEDEVTAKMLAESFAGLTYRTAANRLNKLVDDGQLELRRKVGSKQENAYRPAEGYTWDAIIVQLKK